MKYKILLTGTHQVLINDFFYHMNFSFECLSSSAHTDDILGHLKYYEPDGLIYCLNKESKDNICSFGYVIAQLSDRKIPLIIVGTQESCVSFERTFPAEEFLTITRPFSIMNLEEKITAYLDSHCTKMKAEASEAEDNDKDKAEETLEDKPKETLEEKPKEMLKDKSKETLEDKPKETLKDKSKETSEDKPKETLKDKSKETLEDKSEETPKETPKDKPEETPASTDKMAKEIVKEVAEQKAPSPKPAEPERKKHILLVDDDSGVLKLVKSILADRYNVATAISGKLAMKFLENKETDLVLLDYEMPGESGAEVLQKIRSNEKLRKLPVVFLTGMTDRERIREVLAYSPQGYLLKPIDTEVLNSTLQNILEK